MPNLYNSKYEGVHSWLRRKFGKANKCENPDCLKQSSIFQWSLINGKNYQKRRKNFQQFCITCHQKYDKENKCEMRKIFLRKLMEERKGKDEIGIFIPKDYYRKLSEIAKKNNRSMVGQVRALIDENIKEEKIIEY